MTTRTTIRNIYTSFQVNWRDRFHVDAAALDIWHEVLKDKDDSLVIAAAAQWIAESRWPPVPADIRRVVARLELGDTTDEHGAWHQVQRYVHDHPMGGETKPRDVLSARVVDTVEAAGGFPELRFGHRSDSFRTRFQAAYKTSVERDIESLVALPNTRQVMGLPEPVTNQPLRLEDGGHNSTGCNPEGE